MPLSKREGLMLYWCEGDKPAGKNFMVAVTSADFYIIQNFLSWIEKHHGISRKRIRVRLHLWPDSNEKAAKNYWAKQLHVPLKAFTRSYFKNAPGRNRKYRYGVCRAGIYSKQILEKIMRDIRKEFCDFLPG